MPYKSHLHPQTNQSDPWTYLSVSIFTIRIIINAAWLLSFFDHFSIKYQAIPIFYPVLCCQSIHLSLSFSIDSINLSQGRHSWHMPVCPSVFSVHKFHSTFCPNTIVTWCSIPQWRKFHNFHHHESLEERRIISRLIQDVNGAHKNSNHWHLNMELIFFPLKISQFQTQEWPNHQRV